TGPNRTLQVIRVEALHKSFADVRAVAGVDLQVQRGEVLVLLGQNGAGKSTTLRCLGGILRADAGLIELDGLRIPDRLDAIRRRLGVVPDQARLYGRNTATEYLDHFGYLYGVAAATRRERITRLLERFELADRADMILAAYSRGMGQKIALIRATLHEPDWIFCDEPTAGLEPVAAADMRADLGEQRDRGAALIVTTHMLGEAELIADRVAIMRRGVIVKAGTLDDLRRESGAGRRFVARLAAAPTDLSRLDSWLGRHAMGHELEGERLSYTLPWDASVRERAEFAAGLQSQLTAQDAPFHQLEEQETSRESVYLSAMEETIPMQAPPPRAASAASGIAPRRLFFMSFALLESIKTSIGIWWEKAQGSLEVLLYAPLNDPALIWLEVLPGAAVSVVWVTGWMAAGMALLSFFGQPAPWDLLPAFAFVAAVTAYWAAMGRMLGFMLFPREGAAGGAWSFLLSPVSAAVADLPLALFVFRSPLAPASLVLPLGACLALTLICGSTFDRERLMETGVGRRRRRVWFQLGVVRRNAAAIAAGVLVAAATAGLAGAVSASANWHSWADVRAAVAGRQPDPTPVASAPAYRSEASEPGVTVAAAGLAGIVATLALMLAMVVISFAAFFLLGLPALLSLIAA